jgi:multiple sugar transport system substrate-binding protein
MKTRKISYERPAFALLSLLFVLALVLAACGPAATPAPTQAPVQEAPVEATEPPAQAQPETEAPAATEAPVEAEAPPAEKAVVTYWHSMSNPETAQLDQVIAAFEAANPNIDVQATHYPPDDQSFQPALLTAMAAGELPDAARIDIVWVPQFAREGVLMQLDGAMPGFDELSASVFPGPLSTNFYQGHYYGLPLNTNTQVLLWNKASFEAGGLQEPPKTMEEFAQVACQLSDKANEVYGYAQGGTYFWAPAPVFYAMGGKIVDEGITTASGYINGPESVAAFTMLKDLYDQGCLSPNLMGGGIATDAGHADGKYAMIIDGPWMVNIYKDTYPDFEVNFSLVPTGPDGQTSSVVGGEDIVIFENAQDKEATFQWVSYLMSPEAQKMMAEVGVMPTLAGLTGDPALPPYFEIFMEQLKTAQARVPSPVWSDMDSAINNAYQRMLLGEQNPQESLDQAAEEINALIENGG